MPRWSHVVYPILDHSLKADQVVGYRLLCFDFDTCVLMQDHNTLDSAEQAGTIFCKTENMHYGDYDDGN